MKSLPWMIACIVLVALGGSSCVPVPEAPTGGGGTLIPGGYYVLCEGLWRQDNSTISYVVPGTMNTIRDVVGYVNPEIRLGDTGSDMVAIGDTMYVAVNTTRTIEVFRRSTGHWLGRIRMPGRKEPYRMAVGNGATIYVTNLNDDSMTEIDARTLQITVESVPTGPAPEGIATDGQLIVVANSGLGDLRYREADAGTVYVYQRSDLARVRVLRDLPNVGDVLVDRQRRRCWISWRHRTSLPDSLGGIVCYDMRTWSELGRWRLRSPGRMTLAASTGSIYVLVSSAVLRCDVGVATATSILGNESSDVWYGLSVDEDRAVLWICNARQYVTDGSLLEVGLDGRRLAEYSVGLNPSMILAAQANR